MWFCNRDLWMLRRYVFNQTLFFFSIHDHLVRKRVQTWIGRSGLDSYSLYRLVLIHKFFLYLIQNQTSRKFVCLIKIY